MPRKPKHPEHKEKAAILMKELLDEVVELWESEKEPELKTIAEEVEISPAKLRKLLITASLRDSQPYFTSPTSDAIMKLRREGKTVSEIQQIMGLSYTSVQGYLPHQSVYNLDTMSAECERIRLYRKRKKAVTELQTHINLPDQSLYLWKTVIAFENYPFTTSGRGSRPGVKFKYTVSRSTGAGGRHYTGASVEGYGNELWIITLPDGAKKEKSISRSTVDLAYRRAIEMGGVVSGPKKLNTPGAHSYLYSMFIRFGVITAASQREEE